MKDKLHGLVAGLNAVAKKCADGFARAVVKKKLWFIIAFAVLCVAGAVGIFFVNTNYDSTAYLPKNSEVKQGLSAMYEEFGDGGNASVMLVKSDKNGKITVKFNEAVEFKSKMREIDGVADVMWIDDLFEGTVKTLDGKYSSEQYVEAILLLLRTAARLGSELDGFEISDPSKLVDYIGVLALTDAYNDEINSGNYSFGASEGIDLITVAAKGLMGEGSALNVAAADADIKEILNGFTSSLEMFYACDGQNRYFPLYQLTFTGTDYAAKTVSAIDGIRELAASEGYAVHMSGNAATTYNSIDCVNKQTTYALIAVGIVVLIIMFLFSTSFWEPVLYLAAIGVAVVINMGSNALMGSVSYLTGSVAGILQLALSMDYSIFLISRFKQERKKTTDVEEAMINAIKSSLSPISASSLTTIASFVALMFMSYTIGLDMGIVFAKGVILSLLSVFMFLPGLAVYTNKLIDKSEHKSFKFTFGRITGGILKARFVIPVVCLALIVVAAVGQSYMSFGYGDTATFGSKGSLIYEDKQEIESVFGSQNQLAALLNKDKGARRVVLADGTETTVEEGIIAELSGKPYVVTAQSKAVIASSGMDAMLPEKFIKQFDNGGAYVRLVMYLDLPEESKETEKAIEEIRAIFVKYGVEKGDYYLMGGSSSALEIKEIVNIDYRVITWVSIALVFFILLVTFRNAILPFLLVFVIQGSVWISMSISVLTGDVLVFLGYLIVSAVMLGATIDYGILLTSNYLEARKTKNKTDAMKSAVEKSTRAVLTSSVILCCAGATIAITSTMPAINVFGSLIARTAACSLVLVLVLLPCLLVIFDKIIEKTTLGGRKFYKEHAEITPIATVGEEEKAEAAASESEEK